jgi:hypothetical protein
LETGERISTFATSLFLNEAFEIAEILFHSPRQTRRIEDRTYFQRYFRFLIGARLKANNTRHETVRHRTPGYSATGNSKHDVEDTLLFIAVGMPGIRKACVIKSSHIPQRRDEFREIFNPRPLFIDVIDRRFHNDGLSRCIHLDRRGSHCLRRVFRRRSVHIAPWKKPAPIRR